MSPFDDLALGVKIGFDLDRHRRPEWRMRHLVLARPLHPDRPAAGGFRKQNRIKRHVIGGVMPVAAGALHMLDGDVLERQFEHQRKIGAEKINPLAMGPDLDALSGPLCNGAGRRDRGMREIGAGILPMDGADLCRFSRSRFRVNDRRLGRLGFQPLRQPVLIG